MDWDFLERVVMTKLPQCTASEKMAGVVAGISAVLEGNQSARSDTASWHAWRGFCRAYLNQGFHAPLEPDAEPQKALPWLSQRWKAVAIAALIVLFALLLGVVVRELV